jgi:hypothetical protein
MTRVNALRHEMHVPNIQEFSSFTNAYCNPVTKANRFILYRDIIVICSENHANILYTL